MELTILIPCLNEEETIEICIKKAKSFIESNNIKAEILIVDNGSKDNSVNIAKQNNVRVVNVKKIGYGSALIEGTKMAKGKYIIMGDADDSYNFLELDNFMKKLREGYDIVIGNRYKGKMEKGAMNVLHKFIGTPALTLLVRIIYKVDIHDINCGLRGYVKNKIVNLDCKCDGMEYASEMIIKAKKKQLKITEVPINFYKDKRNRKSHLKTFSDGMRHIKIICKL